MRSDCYELTTIDVARRRRAIYFDVSCRSSAVIRHHCCCRCCPLFIIFCRTITELRVPSSCSLSTRKRPKIQLFSLPSLASMRSCRARAAASASRTSPETRPPSTASTSPSSASLPLSYALPPRSTCPSPLVSRLLRRQRWPPRRSRRLRHPPPIPRLQLPHLLSPMPPRRPQ